MTYQITSNDFFDCSQPAKSDEIYNSVTVKTQPMIESDDTTEVYRSESAILFDGLEQKTIDCVYNSIPVINAVATIEDASAGLVRAAADEYYSWGCRVVIKNNYVSEGSCSISVQGTALQVMGEEDIEIIDDASITENGLQKYEYPVNHLIQTRPMAEDIINGLLDSYKMFRKDCSINWRGDPSLELGDEIEPTVYEKDSTLVTDLFYIYKQKFDFDGTLQSSIEGRKIPDTVTTEGA
jgi:hypothetical protein